MLPIGLIVTPSHTSLSLIIIRVVIKVGEVVLTDSGDIYDTAYLGGRLGVFVYDQKDVIWSKLSYKCAER